LASFFAYGGLAGMFFLMPVQLQLSAGYSASEAGLTLLPLTVLTLVLSPYGGELTTRFGARRPLAAGALSCTVAGLLATRIGADASFVSHVLPVVVLIGIGVPLITPPITTVVLSAVPEGRVGIASAVSNGVARVAGLVVVAALPLLAGLPQDIAESPAALDSGFGTSMLICAGLFLTGGLVSWIGLPTFAASTRPLARHSADHDRPRVTTLRPGRGRTGRRWCRPSG
jgi:MFS family permease